MSAASFWCKINGVLLPTPKECPITEYDMQSADSGRDENAEMHITQTKANLRDADFKWEDLTVEQAALIRSTIAPVEFTVELHFLGSTVFFRAYKGDRKWIPNFRPNEERWDVSFRIIATK